MRNYTDKELLDQLAKIGGKTKEGRFTIIGVQNKADVFNQFDDKFFIYKGSKFYGVLKGTTNAGTILKTGKVGGVFVWKTNQYYEDMYFPGLHKGKMKCLRQIKPVWGYRDTNNNSKADQIGVCKLEIAYTNFHGCDYDPVSKKVGTNIGGWSEGCQVVSEMEKYISFIKECFNMSEPVSYALLEEF